MPRGALNAVARHLRHLAGPPANVLTDAEMLRRFVSDRDEAAFTGLVERHGPLVWAVCRRALRRPEDAEDAFQATFLILARKAGSIREVGKVGSWLYGVAYRTAMRAKHSAARQRQQEQRAPARMPEQPITEAALHELQALLDEEVQRLPEKYRAPFVLCCLEGRSRAEAARELGWKEGTVAGRVAQARERLRRQLARRGIALTAALCATEVVRGAASAIPPMAAAAAREAARRVPSVRAAALAQGVIRAMFATQLKGGAALLLALGLLAAGTAAAARQALAAPQAAAQQTQGAPRPAAKPEQAHSEGQPAPTDRYGDPLPAGAVARLGTVRFRHGLITSMVNFSPDGKILASVGGSRDGIVFWDPHTGRCLRRFSWPWRGWSITFSPDGRLVFESLSRAFFDVDTGKEVRQLQDANASSECSAFSPDGRLVAAAETQAPFRVRLWDAATGAEVRQCTGHTGEPLAVHFAPDGRSLASGGLDQTVRVWDVATGKERLQFRAGDDVYAVAYSPDGAVLASAGNDPEIRLWDSGTGKGLRGLKGHQGPVRGIAFSPDGHLLASAGRDRTVRLWDLRARREVRCWDVPGWPANSVAFSPDGQTLASAGFYDSIRLWEVATGKAIRPPTGEHTGWVDLVRFTPDGKELVSHGRDGKLLEWDVTSGTLRRERFGGPTAGFLAAAALSPNGKILALARRFFPEEKADSEVRLWDTATGKELHALAVGSAQQARLAFSPNGTRLATGGSDGVVRLWDVATGKELYRREPHQGEIDAVIFSPDGARLAASGRDGSIRVWDAAGGKELRHWDSGLGGPIGPLVFSPNGQLLVSTGGVVLIWDTATGKQLLRLPWNGYALGFSPDGRILAASESKERLLAPGKRTYENSIHLWEIISAQDIQHFPSGQDMISCLAFAPDGRTLASGSADSSILLWDLTGRQKSGRLPRARFTAKELDRLWAELGAEAPKAYPAVWALVAAPDQAVPLLRERLLPARRPDPQRVSRLIADLDSDAFSVRGKAARELEGVGDMAGPALREVLAGHPSPEVRRRAEVLLDRLDLRPLRAVAVLEQVGMPQAKEVLRAWAAGAPESQLTREAKASLERLDRHPAPSP